MDIKTLIKTRRREKGLTPAELGKLIGKHRTTIVKYETGAVTNIPLGTLKELSKVLKIPIDKFIKAA